MQKYMFDAIDAIGPGIPFDWSSVDFALLECLEVDYRPHRVTIARFLAKLVDSGLITIISEKSGSTARQYLHSDLFPCS